MGIAPRARGVCFHFHFCIVHRGQTPANLVSETAPVSQLTHRAVFVHLQYFSATGSGLLPSLRYPTISRMAQVVPQGVFKSKNMIPTVSSLVLRSLLMQKTIPGI